MFDDDLDTAQRRVDAWESSIAERAARADMLAHRLAALTATASSDDGLISVTVAPSGALTDLRLDEAVRGQSAARTAAQILATARAARAELAAMATAVTAETVGTDSETGRAVVRSFTDRLPLDPDDGR